MSRGPDAHTRLIRAIESLSVISGCPVKVTGSKLTPWASATFAGAQHLITLEGQVSWRLMTWMNELPEAEFNLRGALVADLDVGAMHCQSGTLTAELEILTVDER